MNNITKRTTFNISILQAREAALYFFRPLLNKWDITEQQWRVIQLLAENGQTDFHDLSDMACILRPSLTGILNRLEKMALVSRRKPATDQRKVILKLTPKGERLYKKVFPELQECHKELEMVWGNDKIKELNYLLQDLRNTVQSYKSNGVEEPQAEESNQ